MNGSNFGDGLLAGLKGAGIGALTGGLIGGAVKGIDAVINGKANFWDGSVMLDLSKGAGANLYGELAMKSIRAIYTGHKFYGTPIYEASINGGVTLPEYGIVFERGLYDEYLNSGQYRPTVQHEYGHILDYKTMLSDANGIESVALDRYYREVGLPSLKSATFNPSNHMNQVFEVRANILAKNFFGKLYVNSPYFPTVYQIQNNFQLPNIETIIKNYIISNCVPF